MCKCGFENMKGSKFCSNCGIKLLDKKGKPNKSLPKMITIKDAYESIFMKKISISKIYSLVRSRNIPHCNLKGRILLDVDKTIEWWYKMLHESTEPLTLKGLRKIG